MSRPTARQLTRIFFLAAIVIAIGLGAYFLRRFVTDCPSLQARVMQWGRLAPLAYFVLSVVASLCFLPRTPLVILAGMCFGPLAAALLDLFSSLGGASVGFVIARHLAREKFRRRLERGDWFKKSPKLKALVQSTARGAGEHGLGFVILIRIVHVFPFCPMNYACGVLPVRYLPYVVGTVIGLLPGTFALTYGGHAFGCALLDGTASLPADLKRDLICASLALVVATIVPIWWMRRR